MAYPNTYLKEEVGGEQLVRKIETFRPFLQVAAQSHGQRINFNKTGRDVPVDHSTMRSYSSILEDTLLGFISPLTLVQSTKSSEKYRNLFSSITVSNGRSMGVSILACIPYHFILESSSSSC